MKPDLFVIHQGFLKSYKSAITTSPPTIFGELVDWRVVDNLLVVLNAKIKVHHETRRDVFSFGQCV